ncbi:DUF5677 domain-containing protein [Baekduia sp. Peel2402]|uniref:DUF5677 domain-containing protein n=1 Tax=Baekduia sp. Peel2402 TaxID=3458296 RepID=UPI00403EDCA6
MSVEFSPDDEKLIAVCETIVALTPETLRVRTEKLPAALIVVALMHRGAKTATGANLLCRAGHGEQALILGRSLFEDMIDAHWVTAHPDKAVTRFDDAALVTKQLTQDRIEPYRAYVADLITDQLSQPAMTDEEAARAQTLVKGYRHGSWTKMGLRRRINDVAHMFGEGVDRELLAMFSDLGEGLASDFVHGSVLSVYSQLDLEAARANKGINFHVGPSSRYVRSAALLCGWSFAHLLSTVLDEPETESRAQLDAAYFALLELISTRPPD